MIFGTILIFFVVGDDDQSIYRFQGASLENILEFRDQYPDAEVIVLTENYRSTQRILDASKALIENNTERLTGSIEGLSKELVACKKHEEIIPQVIEFSQADMETYFVVSKIEELLDQGVDPTEIAVLYRNNKDAHSLSNLLNRKGVPYQVSAGKNLLESESIYQFIQLLKLIINSDANELYYEVLHFDFLGFSPADVLKVHKYLFDHRKNITKILDIVSSDEKLTENDVKEKERFLEFAEQLQAWRKDSFNTPLPDFLERVMKESGFWSYLYEQAGDDEVLVIEQLNIIRSFFNNIHTLGIRRYNLNLEQFIKDLDLLTETGVKLLEQPLEQDNNAVQLLTAHKAKGLEFSYVFLVQCYDKHWGNKTQRDLLKLPTEIVYHAEKINDKKDPNEEERRLFYVAMTRAKKELFITHAKEYKEGREVVPSQFVTELLASEKATETEPSHDEQKTKDVLELLFADAPEKDVTQEEEVHLKALLEDFSLSPTALDNYLVCPRKFKYNYIVRIPGVKAKSAIFGSAVHRALQLFFQQYKATNQLPEKQTLLNFFEKNIGKCNLKYR